MLDHDDMRVTIGGMKMSNDLHARFAAHGLITQVLKQRFSMD